MLEIMKQWFNMQTLKNFLLSLLRIGEVTVNRGGFLLFDVAVRLLFATIVISSFLLLFQGLFIALGWGLLLGTCAMVLAELISDKRRIYPLTKINVLFSKVLTVLLLPLSLISPIAIVAGEQFRDFESILLCFGLAAAALVFLVQVTRTSNR
jgi:hypothetical protein